MIQMKGHSGGEAPYVKTTSVPLLALNLYRIKEFADQALAVVQRSVNSSVENDYQVFNGIMCFEKSSWCNADKSGNV